jgi:hypothetical protein
MVSARTNYTKFSFILLALFLCFPGVMAQTVSFADPDTTMYRDIHMYGFNNTTGQWGMLGLYNTTSTAIELPNNTDVQFVLKPQYTSPLDDPGGWLDSTFAYTQTNLVPLIAIMFLIGLLLTRR